MGAAAEEVRKRLRLDRQAANDAFGEALEAAARREVPVLTGALRDSLAFGQSNPTGIGSITMLYYGEIVRHGARPHDIPNAFGRGITVAHPGQSANDFLARAMASPEVASFLRRLPAILLSQMPQG